MLGRRPVAIDALLFVRPQLAGCSADLRLSKRAVALERPKRKENLGKTKKKQEKKQENTRKNKKNQQQTKKFLRQIR